MYLNASDQRCVDYVFSGRTDVKIVLIIRCVVSWRRDSGGVLEIFAEIVFYVSQRPDSALSYDMPALLVTTTTSRRLRCIRMEKRQHRCRYVSIYLQLSA